MKRSTILILALLATLLGVGLGFYLLRPAQTPPPAPLPEAAPAVPLGEPAEPVIRHPLPEPATETEASAPNSPPPELADILGGQFGMEVFARLFFSDKLILRIVATVDNLPRPEAPVSMFPLRPVAGSFRVAPHGEDKVIAPENAVRYAQHMALLQALPPATAARIYIQFYPRFQQAYRELGYPKAYFNDRLVETLDNLLATPEAMPPLSVQQPKVFYEFTDPVLRATSAGQKILLRMGPENAAQAKQWLREFRQHVARAEVPAAGGNP
ncbi:MAG: hypothetical protein CGU28_01600 [Candidatus Dactylopiibacterium carminicum]|uniref:DUF3014 domain-containing protein n=1 Tax=Candidatus Dactylopiibacterium carminicum TaxID=857335 RepID=A0A272EUE5_9RHOO|nr:DUF3014 domain-containing protein [Candidatus Dactylopiibacterium carminicum]KAF7599761.1 DUF3014 domain-containing protein [Candidatus Dactylopiibacterium carminicum]PAS93715.1 MAG: hypothetical protein CGU29_06490 [Candidatus Dactylopiibacterium carminicum]PAS98284.1 MAG: hypothetical protein CGU28_01600 [Candidatus Dactylopiibacterium carminicum]PAS99762.1 MAG: hypothetical protein BSR46_06085 [Candidatus Dactylopiibacterium carminicum]